jgi:hypothetical protein
MPGTSWHDFYYSAWQEPWGLLVAPFAFLVWRAFAGPPGRGALPALRRVVIGWSFLFAVLTMLDPIAVGPLAKAFPAAATPLAVGFVMLGDLRIWWLVARLAQPEGALPRALLPTLAVPIAAWAVTLVAPPLPGQALWLLHESLFLVVAFAVSRRLSGGFERSVLAYAGVYYALWAACDVMILAGFDAGWLIRCVPNQLYYGLTVPFVWWRFFAPSYAATSSAVHASR